MKSVDLLPLFPSAEEEWDSSPSRKRIDTFRRNSSSSKHFRLEEWQVPVSLLLRLTRMDSVTSRPAGELVVKIRMPLRLPVSGLRSLQLRRNRVEHGVI